jgi:hypothetical protein
MPANGTCLSLASALRPLRFAAGRDPVDVRGAAGGILGDWRRLKDEVPAPRLQRAVAAKRVEPRMEGGRKPAGKFN